MINGIIEVLIGCLKTHLRPHDPHGHTDVGGLERGGVVDTVAGDGHDFLSAVFGSASPHALVVLVPVLEVLDDDQLLLRRGAREDDLRVAGGEGREKREGREGGEGAEGGRGGSEGEEEKVSSMFSRHSAQRTGAQAHSP